MLDRQGAPLADAAPGGRARTGSSAPASTSCATTRGLGRHLGRADGVHVWTVNTQADLELCQSLGVEAVITDRPAYLLELLGR